MKWNFEGYEELYESDLMVINGGDSAGSSSGGGATTPATTTSGSSSGGGATTSPAPSTPTTPSSGSSSGGGSGTPYAAPTGSTTSAGATTPYTGPTGSTTGGGGTSTGSSSTGGSNTPYNQPANGTGGTYPAGQPVPPPVGWQGVDSEYDSWLKQDDGWVGKSLGNSKTETIGSDGCKVVAAAKILSSFANQVIDPNAINTTYNSTKDVYLTMDEIKAGFEANTQNRQSVSAISLGASQINIQGLTTAAAGPGQTYMLGHTSVKLANGKWSDHWVVLEGVKMVAGVATGFDVSPTSIYDDGRKFTIGTTNAAQNEWAIDQIQVFKVY